MGPSNLLAGGRREDWQVPWSNKYPKGLWSYDQGRSLLRKEGKALRVGKEAALWVSKENGGQTRGQDVSPTAGEMSWDSLAGPMTENRGIGP